MEKLHEFSILVISQMIFAGIGYYVQSLFVQAYNFDLTIRALRMTLGYIIPTLWFYSRHGIDKRKLGVRLPSKNTAFNFIGGVLLYATAGLIFVKHEIFFSQWRNQSPNLSTYFLIFILVSITDFWTRGFILLYLAEYHSKTTAIIVQNLVWFIIHWYEIVLLQVYLGWLGAITLTLFLGVGGDLLTLRSGEISGLMIGHFVLNLMVVNFAIYGTPQYLLEILRFIPM